MRKQAKPHAVHQVEVMPLSCPDCSGVLSRDREGSQGHCHYTCQIGHRYSTQSLLHSKERQLEQILWSATVFLKQLGNAYEQLLDEMSRTDSDRKTLRRRIYEVRKQSLAIRSIIEATHAFQ